MTFLKLVFISSILVRRLSHLSGALVWLWQGKVHCHNFTLAVKDLLLLIPERS